MSFELFFYLECCIITFGYMLRSGFMNKKLLLDILREILGGEGNEDI